MRIDDVLATIDPILNGEGWDGQTSDWSPEQCGRVVQAIAEDWAALFVQPWSLAQQAAFVLAGAFHDTHMASSDVKEIALNGVCGDERFQIRLRRSTEGTLPPVPTLTGAGAQQAMVPNHSNMTASVSRLVSSPDTLLDASVALAWWTEVCTRWPSLPAKDAFKVAGAGLALWRACQSTGVLRAGAMFRRMRHPDASIDQELSVRVTIERDLPGSEEMLAASADGGAFLLNF